MLLQGAAGYSRKGPQAGEASRYYSEPQLAARGTLALDGRPVEVAGRAWLDHEWSDALLDAAAVGWDWIGMNLDDGAALTAFRLRRADGSALWAGGSYRPAGGALRDFGADEVAFEPAADLDQPATRARYPVEWRIVDAGRLLRASAPCSTTRSSTAAPAPARSTGKACRELRRRRRAAGSAAVTSR